MGGCRELLLLWALVLAAGGTELVYRPGRRVCAVGVPQGPVTESFVQRVYQPFLTTCGGHRVCSTYRTIYKTAYRRSPGPAPARPRYACCPGWKRTRGLPGACGAAICQPPCQNGGSCVRPGRGHCPAGWQGGSSQTGAHGEVQEEVQRLRTRVDVLEQVPARRSCDRPASSPALHCTPLLGGRPTSPHGRTGQGGPRGPA
ncbi:epidermal growth factor-like protein 7 isoform X5 [Eptesicus fuscus]|uniref:epidermal growth factor-like protein 7 isoform X5 n=1 Tax=Eptesicus fuscus TaxID=29078 RepID=UPI0024044A37|nr:epidermal growth factor-like protein 7 isoform X5 [Eptesicus fuscus]